MTENDMSPRVSVIIPTHNRAGFIGEAIRSVLDQTYSDYEVIVVDDGSTDETARVVAQFGQQVIYLYQDNAGVCLARNAGFAISQGELVLFLDSDDLMLPQNLEVLVGLLDAQPDIDVAYGWQYRTDERGQPLGSAWGATLSGQIFSGLVLEESLMMGAAVIRRGCVAAINGFDESVKFQEHWYFYLRLARAGFTFAYTTQPVVLLRVHSDARHKDRRTMLSHRLAILDRFFDDPALETALTNVRQDAYYKAYYHWAVRNYRAGHFDLGAECLNGALRYAPLLAEDMGALVEMSVITHHASTPAKARDPLEFGKELFQAIEPTPQQPRLRQEMLGQLCFNLAFRSYREGDLKQVRRYALGAVTYNPAWLRNRGLVRIALEGMIGPGLFDWLRSRQHPLSTELLETAAKTTSIFISPHFDDVVLSCGGALAHLAQRQAEAILVTVFTAEASDDLVLSPAARQVHLAWGEKDNPYEMRRQEDKATVDYLGIEHRWLDFLDAVYRDPDLKFNEVLSPAYDPRSDPCFEVIRDAFLQLINEHPGAVVFAPLGLGYHRDHLLVFEALEAVKHLASAGCQVYYYEDYPYVVRADLQSRLAQLDWEAESHSVDISETLQDRIDLIKMHASQMNSLFGGPEGVAEQVTDYATRLGTQGRPRERFWSARTALRQNGTG